MANKNCFILHYNNKLEIYQESERKQMLDKALTMVYDGKFNEDDRKFASKIMEGDYSMFDNPGSLKPHYFHSKQSLVAYRGVMGVEK